MSLQAELFFSHVTLLCEGKDREKTRVLRDIHVVEGEVIFPSTYFLPSAMPDLWAGT